MNETGPDGRIAAEEHDSSVPAAGAGPRAGPERRQPMSAPPAVERGVALVAEPQSSSASEQPPAPATPSPAPEPNWQRAGRRHWPDLAAVVGLLALALGYYWPLTTGQRILYDFDTWVYFYPLRQYAADALRAGRFPLWTPDIYLGAPFFANAQTALLYPLNVVYLLLPVPQALSASAILHTWLAGAFLYLLARATLRLSVGPALLAALAFAFGGYLTGLITHINQLQAAAWLPLLVYLLLGAVARRSVRWAVGGACVLALAVLAGHIQVVYLTLVALGVVAVLAPWLALPSAPSKHRGHSADRAGASGTPVAAGQTAPVEVRVIREVPWWQRLPWRAWAWSLGLYGLLAALGLLLTAVQLIPTAEVQREGIRSGGLSYAEASSFSLPPPLLLQALLPGFWRNPFGEYVAYIGVLPLALALLALAVAPRQWALLGGALAALGLFLALGGYNPVYPVLYAMLPGIGLFRVPARWLYVYSFGAALLAGGGAEWAWQTARARGARWTGLVPRLDRRRVVLVVGTASIVVALLVGLTGDLGARRFYLAWGGLGLLAAALVALTLWRRRLGMTLLVGAAAAELAAASLVAPFREAIPAEVYRSERPVLAPVRADGTTYRTLSLARDDYALGEIVAGRFPYPDAPERVIYNYAVASKHNEVLTPNLSLEYGLASPDGYDGGVLPLRRWVEFMRLVVAEDEPRPDGVLRHRLHYLPDERLLDLMGVKWVITSVLREARWDGVPFDRLATRRLGPGQRYELPVPDVPASAIALLSSVANPELPDGSPIGRLTAIGADGSVQELMVRLGQQTAIATAAAPEGSELAAIAPPDPRLRHVDYAVRLPLESPTTVTRLVFDQVAPSGTWLVRAVTLLGADGSSRPLPLTTRVTPVAHDDPSAVRLYRNEAPLPVAFLVPEATVLDDPAALDYLRSPRWQPARSAVVAPAPEARPLSDSAASTANDTVRILERAPERWRLASEAAGERLLVLTQAFFPGWRATLDGQPVPLVRVNYLFQGVYVPPGTHTIELLYQPRSVAVGLLVSLLALAAAAMLYAYGRLPTLPSGQGTRPPPGGPRAQALPVQPPRRGRSKRR